MKRIFLRNVGKYALVDDEDFERLSQYGWYEHHGYAVAKIKNKYTTMHRFILETPEGICTDHINQNKLDNRRDNLRRCTRAENVRNVAKRHNNTSGYTGVWYYKKIDRWVAGIGKPRKHLGTFKTAKEAALAYNEAARKYFGEFACLNSV